MYFFKEEWSLLSKISSQKPINNHSHLTHQPSNWRELENTLKNVNNKEMLLNQKSLQKEI